MIRAIVCNGRLEPLEPLPRDWTEGTELSIETTRPGDRGIAPENWQQCFEEMEADAALVSPEDMEELNAILAENDRQQTSDGKAGLLP